MSIKINISDLVAKIPVIAAQIEQVTHDERDKLAMDIYADLARETPVDTGAARHGWQVDLVGDQQVITNAVPYIGELNRGHSKQAPAGFIEAVIDRHTRL